VSAGLDGVLGHLLLWLALFFARTLKATSVGDSVMAGLTNKSSM
jgi:hypothetical protein